MKGRSKQQNDKVKQEVKRETLTILFFSEPLYCSQIQNSAFFFMIKFVTPHLWPLTWTSWWVTIRNLQYVTDTFINLFYRHMCAQNNQNFQRLKFWNSRKIMFSKKHVLRKWKLSKLLMSNILKLVKQKWLFSLHSHPHVRNGWLKDIK